MHGDCNNDRDSHGPCFPEALPLVRKTNAKQGRLMNIHLITVVNKYSKEFIGDSEISYM